MVRYLEFHFAFDTHDQFVGVVNEVCPDLARRIHPQTAGKTSLTPVLGDSIGVDRMDS